MDLFDLTLTKDETMLLIESLDAWVTYPRSSNLLGSMIGRMLIKNDKEFEKMEESQNKKMEADMSTREEKAAAIKFKLYGMLKHTFEKKEAV